MNTSRNPVGWFEIYVQDMDRAKAFYEKTFETKLERLDSPGMEMWTFPMQMELPGCPGSLVHMPGKESGTGGTIIYFSCEDCAVETARAGRHGGQVQKEKFSIGEYGFISFVLDPEGNTIGLHSVK